MSLIRAATESTAYGGSNLYARKGTPNRSGLYHYGLDPYSPDMYPQPYISSSSPLCDPTEPSIPGSLYDLQVSSNLYQLMANSSNSPIILDSNSSVNNSVSSSNISHQSPQSVSVSDNQNSPNFDVQMDNLEFDEDEIQLKLQELEHALLGDSDADLMDPYQELGLDQEPVWETSIKEIISPTSPKECSSESSVSCNDDARTPRQLLFDCAAAISEGSIEGAKNIISELRKQVSIQGDPPQRLAAYLTEGLAARIEFSGNGIYKALKCKEPPSSYQLSAMQILFEVCPCFRFGFMAANYAIIEACRGEQKVHIIDFDINQGTQYINLIQALSSHPNKPRKLRITGVDDPESVQRQIGGLRIIGQRLEKLAEDCKIEFEFHALAGQVGEIGPEMLECRRGEALVVNFAFQLHHMPDESVSTVNERDRLLRMVKGLRPKLVTVVEQDVNANTAPFYTRFGEVYNYYSAIFESLDATLPRESADRMNVEKQCLAREIVNIVACEGPDRIERYEAAGKWKARMMMAGFVSCPFNSNVSGSIKALLKSYCDRYRFEEEPGLLHFGWENKILVVASAWK
ncbi:Scarecrow [Rhynchospora pubera]|uniref:Scarecrow n=1 Tax=Rhynchospora pubera TaxID=906938 RepID=A0AAV8G172_9POAL|nr:Scarecrow [Rhynchospora pubera]